MSEFRLSFPAWLLAGKSRLSAEDVLTLRRISFPDGIRASEDAALLMSIHNSIPEKCDEWHGFFIEGLADFVVNHSHPQGSVDDTNAAWLIQALSSDGVVHTPIEFEVLMQVIDISTNVPPALGAFAIDQLRYALAAGIGAYCEVRSIDSRGITRHDVEFVRHVLRRAIDPSGIVLSAVEIEALDRAALASDPQANHPDWARLRQAVRTKRSGNTPRIRWLRVSDDMLAEGNTEAAA